MLIMTFALAACKSSGSGDDGGSTDNGGKDPVIGVWKSVEVEYHVGDTVRITDERLEGFSGTVTKIDLENEMVYVSVSAFFGKETTVELELDQVELDN